VATQAERREATRGRIVESARCLFVERGFDDTTTAMILDDAGVSRGALYHHFDSKEGVFVAVLNSVTASLMSTSTVPIGQYGSRLDDLLAGCLDWLNNVSSPDVATILLDQGPAVLGWRRSRDIDDSHSLQVLTSGIRAAVASGEIETSSVALTVQMVNAALSEVALALAHLPEEAVSMCDARDAVTRLIRGLGADPLPPADTDPSESP